MTHQRAKMLFCHPGQNLFRSHLSQKSSFNTPDFGFMHAQKPQACRTPQPVPF